MDEFLPSSDGYYYYHWHHVAFCVWWTVACTALDWIYLIAAVAFVSMWGEALHPTQRFSLRSVLRRFLLPWIFLLLLLLLVLVFLVWLPQNHNQRESNQRNEPQTALLPSSVVWILVVLYCTALVFLLVRNLHHTRTHIVEGGTMPDVLRHSSDSDSATSSSSCRPRVIVITGANAGIGKETVAGLVELLHPESTLFLLCRSVSKGHASIQDILSRRRQSTNSLPKLHVVECDLTSYASIRRAVLAIRAELPHNRKAVDAVINNAGVMLNDVSHTKQDGHETCLQANFLGPFLLTALFILSNNNNNITSAGTQDDVDTDDTVSNSGSHALIVLNLTSSTYQLATRTFDVHNMDALQWKAEASQSTNTSVASTPNQRRSKLGPPPSYSLFGQYAATKWCNILHSVYLSDRFGFTTIPSTATNAGALAVTTPPPPPRRDRGSRGTEIRSAAIHPGLVRTDVVRNMPWYLRFPNTVFAVVLQTLQKTPTQGAWCTIHVLFSFLAAAEEALPSTISTDKRGSAEETLTSTTAQTQLVDTTGIPSLRRKINNSETYYWVNRHPHTLTVDLQTVRQQADLAWSWATTQVGLSLEESNHLQALVGTEASDHTDSPADDEDCCVASASSTASSSHSKKLQ